MTGKAVLKFAGEVLVTGLIGVAAKRSTVYLCDVIRVKLDDENGLVQGLAEGAVVAAEVAAETVVTGGRSRKAVPA